MSQNGESPEFINIILDSLRRKEPGYVAGEHVYDTLGSRTLTAIMGPTGSGKSTTSDEVILLDSEFRLVNSTMTRPHRDGDPEGFRTGVSYAEFNDAVINGNLVNFGVVGQNVYGTYQSGFPGTHNIGPILAQSVPQLRKSGFRRFNVAYTVSDGGTYEGRLRGERMLFEDFVDRALEGIDSLEFAEKEVDADWMHFVDTSPNPEGPSAAARKVIEIAHGNYEDDLPKDLALQYIQEMTAALKRVVREVQ